MREDLPPPYWSPTGNSGSWYWDESKPTGCWRWADDEQIPSLPSARKKKNWLKRVKDKIFK
jgi:hypothetical protein